MTRSALARVGDTSSEFRWSVPATQALASAGVLPNLT
jgi:hypothetical protein